ncbi:MAG: signal recognition particle-docking protein FtsY, partial [Bacteroidota bacterium]
VEFGQSQTGNRRYFGKMACLLLGVLSKLDGTAKGGVAISISDQFKIPIRYIGVGESIDKLQIFNKRAFVESLFGDKKLN